jgi:hypothetical protein
MFETEGASFLVSDDSAARRRIRGSAPRRLVDDDDGLLGSDGETAVWEHGNGPGPRAGRPGGGTTSAVSSFAALLVSRYVFHGGAKAST